MSSPTQLAEAKSSGSIAQQQDVTVDFFSKNGFELACRISKALSTSDAVPAQFRQFLEKKEKGGGVTLVENPAAIGNCLVAMEVSRSVGLSVIAVMQNADVIQGKLRWSSKFQIAAINASGRFSPLKFKLTNLGRIKAKYKEKQGWNKQLNRYDFTEHEVEIDNWECVAWAYELDANKRPTKEVVQSIPITMQMAVEEGWYSKDGSKWQGSMRFQMLQYRAGTFFGSIYAPDVLMGMGKSSEEEVDVIDVVPQADGTYAATSATLQELRSSPDVGAIPAGGVDTESGEILDQPVQDSQEQQSSAAPFGFEDAIAAVKSGDIDMARDIARSLPDGQQQAVEQAISNRQGESQQAGSRRGRGTSINAE
jgi:hypothetical protein